VWERISVSEFLSGRQTSISQGYLSGLLDDGLGESLKLLFETVCFSITGADSRFVLLNEKYSSEGYGASNSKEEPWL